MVQIVQNVGYTFAIMILYAVLNYTLNQPQILKLGAATLYLLPLPQGGMLLLIQ